MRKVYSIISITIILIAFGKFSFAQDSIVVSSLQKDVSASTWHLFKQVNSVNIYYQYVDCGPFEMVYFKIENSSSQNATITWNYEYENNGTPIPISPDDSSVEFILNPNQIISGQCMQGQYPDLRILVKEIPAIWRLTTIKVNNINVTL